MLYLNLNLTLISATKRKTFFKQRVSNKNCGLKKKKPCEDHPNVPQGQNYQLFVSLWSQTKYKKMLAVNKQPTALSSFDQALCFIFIFSNKYQNSMKSKARSEETEGFWGYNVRAAV